MISVIIPVYNSRYYLEECVDSVLRQTYADFEVLLVDDGSTDSSVEICAGLAREDARIRFLARPHQGVCATRNAALLAAKGEHVFFVDSDDVLHPSCLERLYRQMTARRAALAFCRYRRAPFEEGDLAAWSQEQEAEGDFLNNHEGIVRFCRDNEIFGGIGGKLIAREALDGLRFDTDLSLGEDTLFLYELLRTGVSGVYMRAPLYYYRERAGALQSLRDTAKGLRDAGRVCQRVWQGEEACGRTDHARIWAGEYLRVIKKAMNHLPAGELRRWQAEATQIWKTPYVREQSLRTRGAMFLAFYCHPLYQSIKTVYRLVERGKKGPNDEDI